MVWCDDSVRTVEADMFGGRIYHLGERPSLRMWNEIVMFLKWEVDVDWKEESSIEGP